MIDCVRRRLGLAGLSLILLSPLMASAAFLDKEVVFTEAEVQKAVDKRGPVEKRYGGVLTLTLTEPPKITLGQPDGKVAVAGHIDIFSALVGQKIPVDVVAMGGIRYDDGRKAFFLENPSVESVSSPQLKRDMEPLIREAVTSLLVNYFKTQPFYVLREDGSAQERAARWLLKTVRVEPGKVVATLSPF